MNFLSLCIWMIDLFSFCIIYSLLFIRLKFSFIELINALILDLLIIINSDNYNNTYGASISGKRENEPISPREEKENQPKQKLPKTKNHQTLP